MLVINCVFFIFLCVFLIEAGQNNVRSKRSSGFGGLILWRRERGVFVGDFSDVCFSVFLSRNMGNKPANSPKGQPPDADGHSSVSDLANSLTGDMVMVGQCSCVPNDTICT